MRSNLCSVCRQPHNRNSRYCAPCHAAYMREYRKTHKLEGVARWKASVRSQANVGLRRGYIVKKPCLGCGSLDVQMHHEDYAKPLQVIWLCRPCHLRMHASD